jgi:hypothetical protein
MPERSGHTIAGKPARSAKSELRDKGRDQRDLAERLGQQDDGTSNHPETKQTGTKGASNVGEDQTSGDG